MLLKYNINLGFHVELDSEIFAVNMGVQVLSLKWEESLGPEVSLEKYRATTPVFLSGESQGQMAQMDYSR